MENVVLDLSRGSGEPDDMWQRIRTAVLQQWGLALGAQLVTIGTDAVGVATVLDILKRRRIEQAKGLGLQPIGTTGFGTDLRCRAQTMCVGGERGKTMH